MQIDYIVHESQMARMERIIKRLRGRILPSSCYLCVTNWQKHINTNRMKKFKKVLKNEKICRFTHNNCYKIWQSNKQSLITLKVTHNKSRSKERLFCFYKVI